MDMEQPQEDLHRREKVKTMTFRTSQEASAYVAGEIAEEIRWKQREGKPCVLGLATGSTPTAVYEELVRMHAQGLSFRNVHSFNLDEYYPMRPDSLQSYVRFMQEHLFDHVDMPKGNVHVPDGSLAKDAVQAFCEAYERQIEDLGGIDIQLLGLGRTGHIGFNEPGSSANTPMRMITLDQVTRLDAASDFFGEEHVPIKAITMGVGSILRSKRAILMAWGEGKAAIVQKAVEGPVTDQVPSSFMQLHPQATVVLDEASSAELTAVKTPWLTGPCVWDDAAFIRKAVVWLSGHVGKPILKLTNADYMEHGMADLVTEYDMAYRINIRVFDHLQHTITGWPGGKPGSDGGHRPERAAPFPKRVVIFSPHPDDDVISMGGTFIRLVDQGHEVHVAYQTSGNIAVFDDDAIRFADFVNDLHDLFGLSKEESRHLYAQVERSIREKSPGEIDSKEVMAIKGLIRRGEAKAACRYVGIPDGHVHFLDMPFYETGKVKKKPLGEADVRIIRDLLREIRPHQIYAAGDLSDPHGTHRVCLDAIFRAIEAMKEEPWMKDCYVWLYRGAWQEWEVDRIEMAVPLSPDEVRRKRRAIFKHQSQKDAALFPGNDPREFWERVEDRNHATAELYNKLGLAEYEAIEAFVKYRFLDA
jgi:glucosamine-6-phosphate deaminase